MHNDPTNNNAFARRAETLAPIEDREQDASLTRWGRPLERFTVTHDGGLLDVHEGVGLTAEDVIGWLTRSVDDSSFDDYDLVVWHGGHAVAIVHRVPGVEGTPQGVTRLDASRPRPRAPKAPRAPKSKGGAR